MSTLLTPEKIDCVERIAYQVKVGARMYYGAPEMSGEVRVRVPCTAQHLSWTLNRAQSSDATTGCGVLKFENSPDVALVHGNPAGSFRTDTLDFEIPIQVPLAGILAHFADGDALDGVFGYHPHMTKEFPVTLTVELTDAPSNGRDARTRLSEDEQAATYLDDLWLRIHIYAELGNLSQEMEHQILAWIEDKGRTAKQKLDGWRRIVVALAEKQKVNATLLQEVGETQTPSPDVAQAEVESYGYLSRCIETVLTKLRETKGGLSRKDLSEALLLAQPESENADRVQERARAWLEELEREVGEEQRPRFRYVSVTWPVPEPAFDWQPSREPFPGSGTWTYNPEQGCLECRQIKADWRTESLQYEGSVELPLQRPTGDVPAIAGRVIVETDRLLSGLNVGWKPSAGSSRQAPPIQRMTEITIDFDVDLEAVFKRRRFAVSRALAFEGLLPSKARVRELRDILADAGLTVIRTRGDQSGGGTEVAAIWRREGLPANFVAILTGRQENVKHSVSYDQDKQLVERSMLVGSVGVELKAIGTGDPRAVVGKVNELLLRLQERWGQGDLWQGTWYKEG